MRQSIPSRAINIVTLIFLCSLAAHAADFADVKGDLKKTVDLLEANACPNPLLSELCVTGRTLRPLLLDRPGPVETILDTLLGKIAPGQKGDTWETTWSDSPELISIPEQFCTPLGIDKGYCQDFRCFIADKAKHPGKGCPATPLPASSKIPATSQESPLLTTPGFDKICRGDFCFPSDRNKAEARRFMELDAKAMAADLRSAPRNTLRQRVGSRFRCWVVTDAAIALATNLGFASEDIRGGLNDCSTSKTLLARIQAALPKAPGPIAALASLAGPTPNAQPAYKVLSLAKDSASPVRGVAARLEPADGAVGTTATAHILLLIDSSKVPRAVGDTRTADLQPLETGIAATVTVGPNGALTIPSDFGRPVLAVDYARLAAVLKGIMPASQDFPLAVDSVILAPKLVPISFNASLKVPGLGLTAEFGALSLDCSRSDCGVSVLTDGKALRARLDKELAKLPRLPAAGGVFLKALHSCPDEQEKDCVAGTLVSPNIADVFGTTDLMVKFYPPPNGRAILVPNTISEERLASIRQKVIGRLKLLAPDLRDSWVTINDPRLVIALDVLNAGNGETRLSWTFTAQCGLRLAEYSFTFPLAVSDRNGLNLEPAVQAVSAQVRDQVASYAKRVLQDATVNQLQKLKDSLRDLKIFGQSFSLEGFSCKDNVCTFSLGTWITGVYATARPDGAVTVCFANAVVGPQTRNWIQSSLPHSDGLSITVQKVSIPPVQTACGLKIPRLSIDLSIGLPLLGMDPEPLTVEVDPGTGAVDAMVPDIISRLKGKLWSKAASLKSLPFTIEDIGGTNPITLKGSFAIPNASAALLKGTLSADLYPQFHVSLTCPEGDLGTAVADLLKIPIPIKAKISGCGVFPVHMQVDLKVPVVGTSAKFNIDLGADGHMEIADPVPVPLAPPVIPIGTTPFVIRDAQLALYLKQAGHFGLTATVATLATNQLRMDAIFDANLAERKLSFNGPLLLVGIPLAELKGSFDGQEFRGEAKLLVLANAQSTFLLRLDPLTYVQTLDVNVWNQLTLAAALRIESGSGPCGSSGATSMCLTGEINILNIGKGDVVLFIKPQLSDFASLKANVTFGNIAGLGLRASPKLLAVKIDAGIVKLSAVLPGIAALSPEAILKAIGDALLKMHIDPEAFLKGNWQISLGGAGSGSADGFGEGPGDGSANDPGNGRGDGPNAFDGKARPGDVVGQPKPAQDKTGGKQDGKTDQTGQSGSGNGASEQEPWTPGTCEIHFIPQAGTDKYLRELKCGAQIVRDSCPWSAGQVNIIRRRSEVLMLPQTINALGGTGWPDFSFQAPCSGPQYRVYVTSAKGKDDCDLGVCVLQFGGPPGTEGARNLGSAELLQGIFGPSGTPAAYFAGHKGTAFTAPQWRAVAALARRAWDPAERDIQQISCYLSVGDACEIFVVTRAAANGSPYSLITEYGEMSVPAAIGQLKITKVGGSKRIDSGLVAVVETPSGQMIGWWSYRQTAQVSFLPIAGYMARRDCWQRHKDAPGLTDPSRLLTDFAFWDTSDTDSWKGRGWRKNPLLLFLDTSCN